ncbi:hypothetical protein S40288_10977 [Stachybotrys chartarum IBT 40288]|nr:hypothetical protein S40288_10977 [Stachybotrys chartarum IBT 40288]
MFNCRLPPVPPATSRLMQLFPQAPFLINPMGLTAAPSLPAGDADDYLGGTNDGVPRYSLPNILRDGRAPLALHNDNPSAHMRSATNESPRRPSHASDLKRKHLRQGSMLSGNWRAGAAIPTTEDNSLRRLHRRDDTQSQQSPQNLQIPWMLRYVS